VGTGLAATLPKRTKYGALPSQGKTVPVSCWPTDEDSHNLVSWMVGEVELAGPWPWGGIDNAKAGQIHRFLSEMEKLVWGAASQNQATIKGRRNVSMVNVERLARALAVDLPTLMAEVEEQRR